MTDVEPPNDGRQPPADDNTTPQSGTDQPEPAAQQPEPAAQQPEPTSQSPEPTAQQPAGYPPAQQPPDYPRPEYAPPAYPPAGYGPTGYPAPPPGYGPGPGPGPGPGYGTSPGYGTGPSYGPPHGTGTGPARGDQDGRRNRRMILITAIIAAVIGGGVGAATVALSDNDGASSSSAGLSLSSQAAPAPKLDGSITAAAKKISPSVVTINVSSQQEQDTGSGVIIRPDGYILTNNHVIAAAAGGAGTISVTLNNGKISSAKIVGRDPSDDLAVVKVAASGLPAASFASSQALQVGQTVVAVGAPLGLSDTVTSGIVSNTARPVQTGDSTTSEAVFDAIQTDAAINPGNSGGPLVNLNGDVVGINAAIATDQSNGGLQVPGQQAGNIGIGFAIPADEASRIAAELITTGKATHAIIGATVGPTASSTSAGAKIQSVVPGGPAAKAGLQAGDVVTQLDTQRIDEPDALVAAIRSHAPHTKVQLHYQRGGSSHTVTVTLGEAAS